MNTNATAVVLPVVLAPKCLFRGFYTVACIGHLLYMLLWLILLFIICSFIIHVIMVNTSFSLFVCFFISQANERYGIAVETNNNIKMSHNLIIFVYTFSDRLELY